MTEPDAARTAADPEPIVRVASGFMAAKQLFAANEVGLFAALSRDKLTAGELAARLGIPERSCRIVADAMAGLNLLAREDGRYRNTETSAAYLAGDEGGALDLRPYLTFWNEVSYPHWRSYAGAVREAEPAPLDLEGARQSTFFAGVQTYNAAHAQMLARHYDFGRHERVLDLAGLSGAFLAYARKGNPELGGTLLADPGMVEFARSDLSEADLERIDLVGGDPLTDPLPEGHDAVLLEHVVHRFDPADNRRLLGRAREATRPGARLLILDFYLDEGEPARPLDALLAGEYLVVDGTVVYPEAEVRGWAEDTGWRVLETRTLPGSPRVMIAEAV